jgi:hypothetical protein
MKGLNFGDATPRMEAACVSSRDLLSGKRQSEAA